MDPTENKKMIGETKQGDLIKGEAIYVTGCGGP
jgi:hypothetical protein